MKMFIGYFVFLLFVLCFSFLFVDPNFPHQIPYFYAFSLHNTSVTTLLYIGLLSFSFVFYGYWLYLVKRKKVTYQILVRIIMITSVILLFSFPALSNDIFNYIATAKVLFVYGENPYVIMPIEIRNEPLLQFMHAANKTALYGPFWIMLTAIPLFMGFGSLLITLFTFKLFIIFFYFATCWLLWKMTDKDLFAVSLFACNPLVIIETMINGHNDIVMIFLFLSGIYFIKKKNFFFSFCLLFLSIFIKFASVFLLPVFLYILFANFLGKKLVWNKLYWYMAFCMFVIFLLSPLREEMYPWYAQWFLVFIPFIYNKKLILFLLLTLTFGLLLRYVPFLYYRTYFGPTPALRVIVATLPLFASLIVWQLNKKRITAFFS